ncbi:MAG: sensor histidine kinase KdpD [Asticcacaulis sp.]
MNADLTPKDGRPDPDKLLALIGNDEGDGMGERPRGRLKIFFGANAGVGKTFAMLTEAHRLHTEGQDVLIGVVEHHGRAETRSLTDGLPALPLRRIAHRGVALSEFDLDAALARKPALILMDEYAHTNVPGSRHPKRWQDIEELRDHGIDVFTTLNVQHLESVNDIVARLTGVWVRETVPDAVFDAADEIALIDIAPDALLRRLAEGKVYVAEGANARAVENFFKKTNLGRLREIALRRAAEREDVRNDHLSLAMGQDETATGEKILVLTGPDALSARLIRHTKRMADRSRAPWFSLYLQTSRHETLSAQARQAVEDNLRLAETLGGRVVRLNAGDAATAILTYARQNGFTRLVLGHRPQPLWRRYLGLRSLSETLIARARDIEITTINVDQDGSVPHYPLPSGPSLIEAFGLGPYDPLRAALMVAAATALGLPFRERIDPDSFIMLYMTGVVITAARYGIGPAVMASVLSVAAFNWFFIKPYYTFTFDDVSYAVTFAVMLITSLVVGSLTARLSLHARLARKGEAETRLLYDLSRRLASVRGIEAMASTAAQHLEAALDVDVALWEGDHQVAGRTVTDPRELAAMRWVLQNRQKAGQYTDTLPAASGLYLPLPGDGRALGVLALTPRPAGRRFTGAEQLIFETIAALIAGAFGRAHQASDAEHARIDSENEKLRNVLLASLSHDLKTPLTAMNGAVATLLKMRRKLPREAVDELTALWGQLTRLQKFVSNLLRMAAITSGQLRLNFETYLVQEIVGAALQRIEAQKGERQIRTLTTGQLPLVRIDGALIEQVLINLLENAITHTADNGLITVDMERDDAFVRVRISDNGSGIPPGDEEKIFLKFHTNNGQTSDRTSEGTGLGLAICKGIIEAHGGQIFARNTPEGGASFIFTLPEAKTEE